MVVPVMVIANHPFLDTFRRDIDRDMDLSVIGFICRQDSQLHCVQRRSRVAVRHIRQEIRRLVGNIGAVGSHSFFRIINRPHHKFPDILLFQRF